MLIMLKVVLNVLVVLAAAPKFLGEVRIVMLVFVVVVICRDYSSRGDPCCRWCSVGIIINLRVVTAKI